MPQDKPWLFTPDSAKAMQQRSAVAKAALRENTQLPTLSRLTIVREVIARIRKELLDPETLDEDIAKLAGALDKLLDRERILCGIPLPGQLRPSQPKRMGMTNAQPIDLPALPSPLDVPPDPASNGVPTP